MKVDKTWTLFLDRDGVINERIPGQYISNTADFRFTTNCLRTIARFSEVFNKIIVVTNQQGISKGLMTESDLDAVHQYMIAQIELNGGHIDKVYHCPKLKSENSECRKPNTGMGLQAKSDFSSIDFEKSIMVGDSISDIEFGNRLGMKTVFVEGKIEEYEASQKIEVEVRISNLEDLKNYLQYETE